MLPLKRKLAGAQMIKNLIAVQGATNAANITTKIATLDFSDLDAIADEARTEIIANLDASTATNLQAEGLLDEMVGAIGDTLLDSEDATERSSALATLKTILNLLPVIVNQRTNSFGRCLLQLLKMRMLSRSSYRTCKC